MFIITLQSYIIILKNHNYFTFFEFYINTLVTQYDTSPSSGGTLVSFSDASTYFYHTSAYSPVASARCCRTLTSDSHASVSDSDTVTSSPATLTCCCLISVSDSRTSASADGTSVGCMLIPVLQLFLSDFS